MEKRPAKVLKFGDWTIILRASNGEYWTPCAWLMACPSDKQGCVKCSRCPAQGVVEKCGRGKIEDWWTIVSKYIITHGHRGKNTHTYSEVVDGVEKTYDVYKLINIVPDRVYEVDTDSLMEELEKIVWTDDAKNKIKPIDVLRDMDNKLYKSHKKRIEEANIEYPIIVGNKGEMIDGMHRLCSIVAKGVKTVKCRMFETRSQMERALCEK